MHVLGFRIESLRSNNVLNFFRACLNNSFCVSSRNNKTNVRTTLTQTLLLCFYHFHFGTFAVIYFEAEKRSSKGQ